MCPQSAATDKNLSHECSLCIKTFEECINECERVSAMSGKSGRRQCDL